MYFCKILQYPQMKYKGIIFDFDGTLADTNKGIVRTYIATFKEMGLPIPSTESINATIGLAIKECFLTMDPSLSVAQADEAVVIYRRLFPSLAVESTSAFPGITDLIRNLHRRGARMAIATSRNGHTLRLLTARLNLDRYFELMLSADDVVNHKPAPDEALKALEMMGLSPDEVLVVGDANFDILMGKGAGCRTCACTWGNQDRSTLQLSEPDFMIDSAGELLPIVLDADETASLIKNEEFGGERPLYCSHNLELQDVTIHVGESSIKESSNILARNCKFEGKYVFWECRGFRAENCRFETSARSSLWYSSNGELDRCIVDAPKMFRRMDHISIRDCQFNDAQETLWDCNDVVIRDSRILNADYLGMHTDNVRISNYYQEGNYSFQYSHNVEIHNAVLNSKDALWESENVTVYDSEINGEYLGWYARNLRLVRCHITGEQPLCYCDNLVMEDCTMGDDTILAFEYSTIEATIKGDVPSIKNPSSGHITVSGKVAEIIIDSNIKSPADCVIKTGE